MFGEYCHFETFHPSCRWRNEVIVIKSARYGRMKLGRCVSESTKLGCSADVLEIVSRKCSGKRECEIRVPDSDLGELKPCGEMWTYLEASYTCMKGKLCTCTLAHMLNKWCQYDNLALRQIAGCCHLAINGMIPLPFVTIPVQSYKHRRLKTIARLLSLEQFTLLY